MGGIYTSSEDLDFDSLYCDECGDSDWPIGEADTFTEAFQLLRGDSSTRHYELGYIHRLLCEEFSIKNPFPLRERSEFSDASDEEILREIRYLIGPDQWMERWDPQLENGENMPCVMVAVNSALRSYKDETEPPVLRDDGYCTLQDANKYIRKYLPVKKRMDFKRGSRPKLRDIPVFEPAIVCVKGHYIYWHGDGLYESYFDNANDEVVTAWILKKDELY